MKSLKQRLTDWQDFDSAAYEIGVCLGFWQEWGDNDEGQLRIDNWHGTKGIFWSENPLGNALHQFLIGLVKEGMLEYNEDNLSFRWNQAYEDN